MATNVEEKSEQSPSCSLEHNVAVILCWREELAGGMVQAGSFVVFLVFLSMMVLATVPHLLFTLNATVITC